MHKVKQGNLNNLILDKRSPLKYTFSKSKKSQEPKNESNSRFYIKGKFSNIKKMNLSPPKIDNINKHKFSNSNNKKFFFEKESIKNDNKAFINSAKNDKKLVIIPREKKLNTKFIFQKNKSNDQLSNPKHYFKQTSLDLKKNTLRPKKSSYNVNFINNKNEQQESKSLFGKKKELKIKNLSFNKLSLKLEKTKTGSISNFQDKDKRVVKNFIQLENKFRPNDRSLDYDRKKEYNIGKIHKLALSANKEDNNIEIFDKPFNYQKGLLSQTHKPKILKSKEKNKYYDFLKNRFKENKLGIDLIKKVKNKFIKWNDNERAEFYKLFLTDISFYKIIQQIGKGCFGKVYLAIQILTGTQVALKVIPRTNIKNKNTFKKIQKEVKILKQVNHNKAITKLFEVFQDEKYVYMVFEYVSDGDLVKYFKINPLLEEEQLKLFFYKILKGIQYLHDNDIIHRDIKLDNILIDKKLNPKICDFGISSEYDPEKFITDTGGTPAYLSPEVIKAEGNVCPKSDIWSLGILLYLLGYGVVPFQAKNMQCLYNKIIIGKFKFPECEFLSEEFRDLIQKMLVIDIKERYDLNEIFHHPWMKKIYLQEEERVSHIKETEKEKQKIQGILDFLEDLNFPKDYIEQSLGKNLFNHVKACRDSLFIKFNINHILQFISQILFINNFYQF